MISPVPRHQSGINCLGPVSEDPALTLPVARTNLLRTARGSSPKTLGTKWADDVPTSVSDTGGGRKTRKVNTYRVIRNAMDTKDDSATMSGEDAGFDEAFRRTLGYGEEFGRGWVFNISPQSTLYAPL